MDFITISQVSKGLGISTRALRYYEQIGLLKSYSSASAEWHNAKIREVSIMPVEFRHYKALEKQLSKYVDESVKSTILTDMDNISDSSSPKRKARWAAEISKRMDENLDEELRMKIRKGCACVLSIENVSLTAVRVSPALSSISGLPVH